MTPLKGLLHDCFGLSQLTYLCYLAPKDTKGVSVFSVCCLGSFFVFGLMELLVPCETGDGGMQRRRSGEVSGRVQLQPPAA